MIDVSVVLVNYNSSKLLENCLESLIKHSKNFCYEIIVIDNTCSDIEKTKLESLGNRFKFKLIYSKNVGFGNANNLAAKSANGKYLFFLNCDTVLISNACYELFNYLESNPNVGVAGSNLYNDDKKPNYSFQYCEKNYKNEIVYSSLIFKKKNKTFNYTNQPLKIYGYVSGACLMISKKNFDIIGGFPKDIFLYAEEAYLCYQVIHKLNLEVYNVPSSKIIHLEGRSFSTSESRIRHACNGNYVYYKLLFGDEIALKYLKKKSFIYGKYALLCMFIFKIKKSRKFRLFKTIYREKYLELKRNG